MAGESTALATVPNFSNQAEAARHYAKHVKGVTVGSNGRLTARRADMPEFGSMSDYVKAAREFHPEGDAAAQLKYFNDQFK